MEGSLAQDLAGLRLLIVTPDIAGPIRNGGIGTAFAELAAAARRWGCEVTIAYALGAHSEGEPIERWVRHYAAAGITLVPLDDAELAPMPALDAPAFRILAWQVHHWLRRHEARFDIVVFPEWMGLAYYVLLAKGQRLAFRRLAVLVNAHSPETWALAGNRLLPASRDAVDRDFLERETVRRADALVSPSAYMIGWMRAHRWGVPATTHVAQNLLHRPAAPHDATVSPVDELVFFGRLEPRKGLGLFCDALDRLPPGTLARIRRVTFMGKEAARDAFDSAGFIERRTRDWAPEIRTRTDLGREEALRALAGPGVLAVIPSLVENSPYTVLECLRHGVRFLASRVGGIPELVAAEDHAACLFDPVPGALADSLVAAIGAGMRPARGAQTPEEAEEAWRGVLVATRRSLAARLAAPAVLPPAGTVSVCLVHHNRPQLLARALASLTAQTRLPDEVVVVDDGSTMPEALAYLDRLEPELTAQGWRLLRQRNRYLGAARNAAAAAARGDWLMFMDDDNIAMPHEVETFLAAAAASGADVLTTISAVFTGDETPDTPAWLWLPLGGAIGPGLFGNAFGDANALWRREVFQALGGYSTDYGIGHEDWELFAHAVLGGYRLEIVPEPLFWYRLSPQGMLRSGNPVADHARSLRPFLAHDPHGLGVAAGYALSLHLRQTAMPDTSSAAIATAVWRGMLLMRDPVMRSKLRSRLQRDGVTRGMGAVLRALARR
jgi:GT2 family glycosyltransferase/glycosyltransferase involved in cell wall biosynthesis